MKSEWDALCVFNALSDSTSVDIDMVFEPFYCMDAWTTAVGFELGLYVMKLLCERLGWKGKAEIRVNVIKLIE